MFSRGIEIKTPEQLCRMRIAGLVVARTHEELARHAVPGTTTGELDQMAREISKKIEHDLQYPGQIKVTVIREVRAISYAK